MDIKDIELKKIYKWKASSGDRFVYVVEKSVNSIPPYVLVHYEGEPVVLNPTYIEPVSIDDFKPVEIPGSESYWYAYEFGKALSEKYPKEACDDFAYALQYAIKDWHDEFNVKSFNELNEKILDFKCLYEGANDGESWIWRISLSLSYRQSFLVIGWCDYTGWDCKSGGRIEKL